MFITLPSPPGDRSEGASGNANPSSGSLIKPLMDSDSSTVGDFPSYLPDPKEVCPFNIPAWEALSSDMPNSTLRDYVMEGLHNGFRLRFHKGPLRSASRNNPSSYSHMEVVDEYITSEIARGSIAGPFSSPPFPDLHVQQIWCDSKIHPR